jgi:hypothetical protein
MFVTGLTDLGYRPGESITLMCRSAGHCDQLGVDRVLKGTKPGDLPIEQPSVFGFDQSEDRKESWYRTAAEYHGDGR